MSRSWWFRTTFLIILVLASCYVLMPTVVEMVLYPEVIKDTEEMDEEAPRNPQLPDWYTRMPDLLRSKTLSLGLDLQGGLMMQYSVDIDSAIDDKMTHSAATIREVLAGMGKSCDYVIDHENHTIKFSFLNASDVNVFTMDVVDDNGNKHQFIDDYQMLSIVDKDNSSVTLGLRENYFKDTEESAIKQAVEIVRERIDSLGVAQPNVRVEAGTKPKIVVELPGLSRSKVESAKKTISQTAVLKFKLVAPKAEANALFTELSKKITPESGVYIAGGMLRADDEMVGRRIKESGRDKLRRFVRENERDIPGGREIDFEKVDARELRYEHMDMDDAALAALPTTWRMRLVRSDMPELSGDNVENAYPARNSETNMPYVALKLDHKGGDIFYNITKEHVGDQLAILMGDQLVSDPVIRSEIPGGNVSIEMGRGNPQQVMDDVNALVVSLRSGALPAPIRSESETLVGPTMGRDSIESGMISLAIGFALVFLFMMYYYKASGLVASFALTLNVLFILAGMATMGASLTMPGIAGIVLTVGMSVDANVIVFERIREELRSGETPRKAILAGYDKALSTILDSNITTAIAAIVLMNFGSGPVKGFAVTLLLGIVSTVYTAFFVTKTIFERQIRRNPDRMSI